MTIKTMLDTAACPDKTVIDLAVEQNYALAVYIGGAGSAGSGYTPEVTKEMWSGFFPVYVPAQDQTANAITDANEAVGIVETYGADCFAIDLEEGTVTANETFWADYVSAFVPICHASGKRLALYTSQSCLSVFAECANPPDAIWVGKWIGTDIISGLDPHKIPGTSNALWLSPGQRAWQYSHAYDFNGDTFDVSVIDSELLTFPVVPPEPAPAVDVPTPEPSTSVSPDPTNPVAQTYTVQYGDTLWSLAQKFGIPEQTLYDNNKDVIEAAAVHNGYQDSRNGALIWPGEVLKV